MKKTLLYIFVVTVVLFSCKRTKQQMIVGSWHAVGLENPEMDSFFKKSQLFIDTMGNTHNDALNMALYGTVNMDSVRAVMQQQYDSAKIIQKNAVLNTLFTFKKDSVAVLSFNGTVDSGKWFFNEKGALVVAPIIKEQANEKVEMEVISLSDTLLKLKLADGSSFSIVTFKPEK